jgi:SPP1 gp7 family putative phage head morphogenesis protein
MARVTGPSRAELDERGDEFAARVTRAIRTTLRSVAPTTRVVDDLGRIETIWRSVVKNSLAPHLREQWNAAVLGVRVQLEELNARERETLLAAGFVIPQVSNVLAENFLAEATNRLVAIGDVVWYTARGEMLAGMQLGEGVAELRERVVASANVSHKRAEVIARTEVNSAMNNGAYQQMKALDVPTIKEWIATNDSRTRESHEEVDGEEIAGDAKFMVGGFPMDHPHDLNAPPSQTVNCRCALAWEIDDDDDYWDELVADASFHHPGQHEQKNHGRRYKTPGDKSSGLRDTAPSGKKSSKSQISPKGQRVLDFIKDDTKQPLPASEANGHWYSAFDNPNFSPETTDKYENAIASEKAPDAMHAGYIPEDMAKAWLPIKKVDPASLVQTQKWLRQIDLSQSVSSEEGDRDPIIVYRAKDGTRYLTNGHHRINLALAKGIDEIEVREATSTIDVPSVVSPRRKETPRNALITSSESFHLPGRHEQKNHGRRSGKNVGSTIKSTAKSTTKSLTSILDSDAITQLLDDPASFDYSSKKSEDRLLAEIVKQRGFDAKPTLVDSLPAGSTPMGRAVTERQFAEQFLTGDYFAGKGQFGNGTYFLQSSDSGNLDKTLPLYGDHQVRAALKPGARTITRTELEAEMKSLIDDAEQNEKDVYGKAIEYIQRGDADGFQRDYGRAQRRTQLLRDPGRVAALLGYDAIFVTPGQGDTEVVVLNRGALQAERGIK